MPPPRRRRPVQPATRVRLPRTARPRSIPATELPEAEAPEAGTPEAEAPEAGTPEAGTPEAGTPPAEAPAPPDAVGEDEAGRAASEVAGELPGDGRPAETAAAPVTSGAGRSPLPLAACLGAVAVILGGLAVWFGLEASRTNSGADTANVALTDPAATSQVTGQISSAVNTIFSFNYADTAKTRQAADHLLTGVAHRQYSTLFKLVQQDAPKLKLVLTTTVTNIGVSFLIGDHAQLLIFADQRDTSGAKHSTTEAGAMFSVNAVRQDGRWKIANINPFHRQGVTPG
jgi:Mce-associated membrane protein